MSLSVFGRSLSVFGCLWVSLECSGDLWGLKIYDYKKNIGFYTVFNLLPLFSSGIILVSMFGTVVLILY